MDGTGLQIIIIQATLFVGALMPTHLFQIFTGCMEVEVAPPQLVADTQVEK
jgi:hypothetical protein